MQSPNRCRITNEGRQLPKAGQGWKGFIWRLELRFPTEQRKRGAELKDLPKIFAGVRRLSEPIHCAGNFAKFEQGHAVYDRGPNLSIVLRRFDRSCQEGINFHRFSKTEECLGTREKGEILLSGTLRRRSDDVLRS